MGACTTLPKKTTTTTTNYQTINGKLNRHTNTVAHNTSNESINRKHSEALRSIANAKNTHSAVKSAMSDKEIQNAVLDTHKTYGNNILAKNTREQKEIISVEKDIKVPKAQNNTTKKARNSSKTSPNTNYQRLLVDGYVRRIDCLLTKLIPTNVINICYYYYFINVSHTFLIQTFEGGYDGDPEELYCIDILNKAKICLSLEYNTGDNRPINYSYIPSIKVTDNNTLYHGVFYTYYDPNYIINSDFGPASINLGLVPQIDLRLAPTKRRGRNAFIEWGRTADGLCLGNNIYCGNKHGIIICNGNNSLCQLQLQNINSSTCFDYTIHKLNNFKWNSSEYLSLCNMNDIDKLFIMECFSEKSISPTLKSTTCGIYDFNKHQLKYVKSYKYNRYFADDALCVGLCYDTRNSLIYSVTNYGNPSQYDMYKNQWIYLFGLNNNIKYKTMCTDLVTWIDNTIPNILYCAALKKTEKTTEWPPCRRRKLEIKLLDMRNNRSKWIECYQDIQPLINKDLHVHQYQSEVIGPFHQSVLN
eukprot:122812_1